MLKTTVIPLIPCLQWSEAILAQAVPIPPGTNTYPGKVSTELKLSVLHFSLDKCPDIGLR